METSLAAYQQAIIEPQIPLFPFQPETLDQIVPPSSNPLGIANLDLSWSATELVEPFLIWGSIARSKYMPGTYGMYCEDYKFNAVFNDPDMLLKSKCAAVVEANRSISPRMPPWKAIEEIGKKRWLSWYWGQTGKVKIFVDMNVPPVYAKLNLLGIPVGWKAYCVRVHRHNHHWIEYLYALCQEHAQGDPLFVVYGGDNKFARQLCQRKDWTWIPDKRSALKWGQYHG